MKRAETEGDGPVGGGDSGSGIREGTTDEKKSRKKRKEKNGVWRVAPSRLR